MQIKYPNVFDKFIIRDKSYGYYDNYVIPIDKINNGNLIFVCSELKQLVKQAFCMLL